MSYLRGLLKKDIWIGGIMSAPSIGIDPSYNNATIKTVGKYKPKKWKVILTNREGPSEGMVFIKALTDYGKIIIEKIIASNKTIGKTLGELLDTSIENI